MAGDVSTSGLTELEATFGRIRLGTLGVVDGVVTKAAQNVKTDAAQRVSGLRHAPAYPASISYDVSHGIGTVEAEIGPDKGRRQGALGNILEYGTVKNAPIPHLSPALDAEAPRFERALAEAAEKMWGE